MKDDDEKKDEDFQAVEDKKQDQSVSATTQQKEKSVDKD